MSLISLITPLDPDEIKKVKEENIDIYSTFLEKASPEYTKQEILALLTDLFDHRLSNIENLTSWLIKNFDLIEESEINPGVFFEFMYDLMGAATGSNISTSYFELMKIFNM